MPIPLDTVRQIAFAPPHDEGTPGDLISDWALFLASVQFLTSIYRPRVTYVLLTPAELAKGRRRPRREDSPGTAQMVEGFISAYGGGRALGPWARGEREYYEIPLEEVRRIRCLRALILGIECHRRRKVAEGVVDYEAVENPGKYCTRHRFMSWRYVGGSVEPEESSDEPEAVA